MAKAIPTPIKIEKWIHPQLLIGNGSDLYTDRNKISFSSIITNMMKMLGMPPGYKKFAKQAQKIIDQGLVENIEFSGETYQLLVQEKKESEGAWAFMQLDPKGSIKDSFCSCEESEDDAPCIHVVASYLRIYNGRESPLHLRFKASLWNELCLQSLEKYGDDPALLQEVAKKKYAFCDETGQCLFYIKAKKGLALNHLEEIIKYRKEETEETSLKFSNLTAEDLDHWREGKPSPELRYELSFWSDIAKWLMLMQDRRQPYNITFEYSQEMMPVKIKISFPEIEVEFSLTRQDLIQIIPALGKVNSPLAVHTTQRESIQEITYDKEQGILNVHLKEGRIPKPSKEKVPRNEIVLGGWSYVPGEAFYAIDQHHILARPNITGKRISDVLNTHAHVIKRLLVGDALSEEPVKASYHLAFDDAWNLHLTLYLFEPGDISKKQSRSFGDWVYLEGQGFYRLEGRLFEEIEKVIPREEVHDFIAKQRTWLNTIEGFETHLISLEVKLAYHVDADGTLLFERCFTTGGSSGEVKDFGPWVYIQGQGFYSKARAPIKLSIDPGIPLAEKQVPLFVQANREELNLIQGFFSESCPIAEASLEISIVDPHTVEITPRYTTAPEYAGVSIRYYGDLVYAEGKGFYELPIALRLPEEYRHKVILKGKALSYFLEVDFSKMSRFVSKLPSELVKPQTLVLEAEKIIKQERSGKQNYGMQLYYSSEMGQVSLSDLWEAVHSKQPVIFCSAGLIILESERFSWLRRVKKKQIDRRSNMLYLPTLELYRLNAFDPVRLRQSSSGHYTFSKALLEEISGQKSVEEPDISQLKSTLRPYQKTGVSWLWFLYLHELSGLLCDDMGLGKTHQAMALMAAVNAFHAKHSPGKLLHFLVVCPTSVIYHWEEKLQKFFPDMRVCTYHGANRSFQDFRKEYDILLTSYGVLRNEVIELSKVPFELAIFDEVQIAKNHASRTHKALIKINAAVRIGLTGTPIENRLRELKALFDIVLPSFMPSNEEYLETFVKPIEKENDQNRKELLTRIIKPFLLRRKKEEVLTDLPPKIEQISHCELSAEQHTLYNEVLSQARRRLVNELENDSCPVPYIHVFALLSNLKQICNHPAVYHKTPENFDQYQSGKWNLFIELLSEARDSRQKVVVFSQYLHMLDIIEKYLTEKKIAFATIRGATIRRGEEIHRFNNDPACEVFLGSLQAAGLGVDLTAASVVIHYDRWWNAAREDQATDRVHRIGQTRGVQVFKLVTKNTFEEKIDELIEKKGKLMEEVVGADDANFVKKFSRDELIELLQYVEWS